MASLPMRFSGQEYCSELLCPPPGDRPTCTHHPDSTIDLLLSILVSSNSPPSLLFFKNIFLTFLFILFLAALGLRCYAGFSLVVESRGCSLVEVCRLLLAVASLAAELRLWGARASGVGAHGLGSSSYQALEYRLNNCSTWAYLLQGM